jgi:hypothetical protein
VDLGFLDMSMNLYLSSFKPLGIENYLFMALDSDVCDVMSARNINCYPYYKGAAAAANCNNVVSFTDQI